MLLHSIFTILEIYDIMLGASPPSGEGQAFLGVQDGTAPAQWVGGGESDVWWLLAQTLTATSDQLILYLHENNGTGLNTNVYFDDVTVTEPDQP